MKPRIEDIEVKEGYPRDEIISLFNKMCGSLNMEYVLDSQSLFKWRNIKGDYIIEDANENEYIITPRSWYIGSNNVIILAQTFMYRLYLWVGGK